MQEALEQVTRWLADDIMDALDEGIDIDPIFVLDVMQLEGIVTKNKFFPYPSLNYDFRGLSLL